MDIMFLGGTGTVPGSKYLVTCGSKPVLVDCGLFQGFRQLRLKNWAPLPVAPWHIEAVILPHAHVDHSGYLLLLVKNGFTGADVEEALRSCAPVAFEREVDLGGGLSFRL
jgi:metallo-beta-lactamase family protein